MTRKSLMSPPHRARNAASSGGYGLVVRDLAEAGQGSERGSVITVEGGIAQWQPIDPIRIVYIIQNQSYRILGPTTGAGLGRGWPARRVSFYARERRCHSDRQSPGSGRRC